MIAPAVSGDFAQRTFITSHSVSEIFGACFIFVVMDYKCKLREDYECKPALAREFLRKYFPLSRGSSGRRLCGCYGRDSSRTCFVATVGQDQFLNDQPSSFL